MNHSQRWFICFALVVMVCIGLSCGFLGAGPEVYLVKDSEDSFHFRWNEPPITDRIILTRATYSNKMLDDSVSLRFSPGQPTSTVSFELDEFISFELDDFINVEIEYGEPYIKFEYDTYQLDRYHYWDDTVRVDSSSESLPNIDPILETLEFTVTSNSTGYSVECVNMPQLVYNRKEIEYFTTSDAGDLPRLKTDGFTLVYELAPDHTLYSYTVVLDVTATYSLKDSFQDQLVLLKAGGVESKSISLYHLFNPPEGSGICTITVLPDEERENVKLPAEAYDPDRGGYEKIRDGHPLQPYDVRDPSELVLNYTTDFSYY